MGPSEDDPDRPHPSPPGGPAPYPLGTAKVDALVSPTADHLDVSVAWKRRRRCIRPGRATPRPDWGQGSHLGNCTLRDLLGVREGFPEVKWGLSTGRALQDVSCVSEEVQMEQLQGRPLQSKGR